MRMMLVALLALPIAGCVAVAVDAPGQIVAANGKTVTVRGPGDYSPARLGKPFVPNAAVSAQAAGVCAGAKFASGMPAGGDLGLIDYLFICP